ncbi:hypothetical protein Acr_01g0009840 [Actinidia rufa]|uniref:Uncharacterized protein n=1 Tax=Actinidia rufa TaxID=165716 RepID=A0A7J0E478_9ERIC|nr:hypothetical protein Acr_01g0009840 [Actinidia rufa]
MPTIDALITKPHSRGRIMAAPVDVGGGAAVKRLRRGGQEGHDLVVMVFKLLEHHFLDLEFEAG